MKALYGTAVWLGADEVGVPLAALSGPPVETPLAGLSGKFSIAISNDGPYES